MYRSINEIRGKRLTNDALAIDQALADIADYVVDFRIKNPLAYETARYCLLDSLGCAIAALESEECLRRLGPIVPGATLNNGARIPGTSYELDPVRATFNLGAMVRWQDYNDTWLAAEWGHPSDNLCAILACADYLVRNGQKSLYMRDVLTALIKAYEIQGILALNNSFNQIGLDHVILVRIASCAVTTHLLDGNRQQIINALSNAWLDGAALRTYRHGFNSGWRKSWAAGDAAARGVQHALMSIKGEMGYPTVLSAKEWGFNDVILSGQPLNIPQPFRSYVIENILFKIGYPVEFHAHTAVECALTLYKLLGPCIENIYKIKISTQKSALRIIDKAGPLHNPADRDHCLQYAVAVALIFGELTSKHYEDQVAHDSRIDALREKIIVDEDLSFSRDYLDPEKRSIANRIVICFDDGSSKQCQIEYPLGHRRRRIEAIPLLFDKFKTNIQVRFSASWIDKMTNILSDQQRLESMSVDEFLGLWVFSG